MERGQSGFEMDGLIPAAGAWPGQHESAHAQPERKPEFPEWLEQMVDLIAHPALVVDADAILIGSNRSGARLLRESINLHLVNAALRGRDGTTQKGLRKALDASRAGLRSEFGLNTGTGLTLAFCLPVRCRAVSAPLTALIFERTAGCAALALTQFGRAHKLTATEYEVLDALSKYDDVLVVAQLLGVAKSTVRTHIRNLLSKTGEMTLRALLLRIAALPPLALSIAGTERFPTRKYPHL